MSIAAAQYDKFKEQVVNEGRAFTFMDRGALLVYPMPTGNTVPFWSSRSRLESIQKALPKYRQWDITELPFRDFWKQLDSLERDETRVGVNWSGKNLTGYNVSVGELREGLQFYIHQYSKHHLLDAAI